MTNSHYHPIKFYKRFHKGVTTCFFYWSDRISTLLAIVWDREYVLSIATCRLIKPLLCFDGHSFLLLLLWWPSPRGRPVMSLLVSRHASNPKFLLTDITCYQMVLTPFCLEMERIATFKAGVLGGEVLSTVLLTGVLLWR